MVSLSLSPEEEESKWIRGGGVRLPDWRSVFVVSWDGLLLGSRPGLLTRLVPLEVAFSFLGICDKGSSCRTGGSDIYCAFLPRQQQKRTEGVAAHA